VVQVIWSRRAAADLVAIRAHISRDRPLAAMKMAQRLADAANRLEDHPERGRAASGGARELAVNLSIHHPLSRPTRRGAHNPDQARSAGYVTAVGRRRR